MSKAWYCLRSQPKHEHIAAAQLRRDGCEVYLPRIRFKRSTRRGPVWFTEALFPNYLFVRFELATCLRKVQHTRGVQCVIHFGARWPVVPDSVVQELQATIGESETRILQPALKPGDEVELTGGVLHGLAAVVTRVMPASKRVAVLLDFLGRQTAVEVCEASLVADADPRSFTAKSSETPG